MELVRIRIDIGLDNKYYYMVQWKKARKKPIEVSVRGPISEEEKHEVHAGELYAEDGYFIIDDGKATYPVEPDVFYETYQVPRSFEDMDGWNSVQKKPVEVHFRGPLESSEVVNTMEGRVRAESGNYIIKGVEGEKYPIEADEFNRLYEVL